MVSEQMLTVGALTSFLLYAGYTALSLSGLTSFYTELNKGIVAGYFCVAEGFECLSFRFVLLRHWRCYKDLGNFRSDTEYTD